MAMDVVPVCLKNGSLLRNQVLKPGLYKLRNITIHSMKLTTVILGL